MKRFCQPSKLSNVNFQPVKPTKSTDEEQKIYQQSQKLKSKLKESISIAQELIESMKYSLYSSKKLDNLLNINYFEEFKRSKNILINFGENHINQLKNILSVYDSDIFASSSYQNHEINSFLSVLH